MCGAARRLCAATLIRSAPLQPLAPRCPATRGRLSSIRSRFLRDAALSAASVTDGLQQSLSFALTLDTVKAAKDLPKAQFIAAIKKASPEGQSSGAACRAPMRCAVPLRVCTSPDFLLPPRAPWPPQ